jgi:glucose-6-phosphate isomerase
MASSALICDTEQWKGLQAHVGAIQKTHLRDLMDDAERCKAMTAEYEGIFLDYSRQRATGETMEKLFKLAEAAKLKEKIEKMFSGDKVSIIICKRCSVF